MTTQRSNSFLISYAYFTNIYEHFFHLINIFLIQNGEQTVSPDQIKNLTNSWIDKIKTHQVLKKPEEIKVLYLSGPEPTNDLNVFLNNGILPHNIWAVESESKEFKEAIHDLQQSGQYIKLHKGSLKEVFRLVNQTFDIVYFDACTPILSKDKNPLDILKELFLNKRLNELSVLITNFSQPSEQNNDWDKVMAAWFAGRYEDCPSETFESRFADVEERYANPDKYAEFVGSTLNEHYSMFIPALIASLGAEIVPSAQLLSMGSVQSRYFWDKSKLGKLISEINDIDISAINDEHDLLSEVPHHMLTPGAYPLMTWIYLTTKLLPNNHPILNFYNDLNGSIKISYAIIITELLKRIEESYSGFKTKSRDVCGETLRDLLLKFDWFDRNLRLTCDTPMKNLLVELIMGLYGFPYIANSDSHLSLTYKAKETQMYTDVFVFDQARYMYDLIPSIEFIYEFLDDLNNQIFLRCCIDGIKRKHIHFNKNLFLWGFIESIGDKRFPLGKSLNRELLINLEPSQ